MSRPGRKRKIGDRFPAGQIRPEEQPPSPAAIRRLRSAALAGMADQQWGTMAGLFFLNKKIDEVEYETAKRFGDLHSRYVAVIGGPRPPKTSTGERPARAAQIDVDTEQGGIEAERHIAILTSYNDAHGVLLGLGPAIEADLIRFCAVPGESPAGHAALMGIRDGLRALAGLWKVRI